MRLGFSAFLFLFSLLFFLLSLQFEFFTDDGKPGPGLFPITIGLLLLIFTGMRGLKDLRDRGAGEGSGEFAKDVLWLLFLTFMFVLLMAYIGGVLAMVLYIFSLLGRFNRKRYVQNLASSIIIPAILFAVFDLWLHAGLPKGFLGFM